MTTDTKSIEYAYPSSPRATQFGYGIDGCYFITIGKKRRENYGVYATKDDALVAFARINLPVDNYSLVKP